MATTQTNATHGAPGSVDREQLATQIAEMYRDVANDAGRGLHFPTGRRLAEEVAAAQAAGELDPGAEPVQVAFELNAFMVLGNMQFVAGGDAGALDRVRQAVDGRLVVLAGKRAGAAIAGARGCA